MIKAFLLAGFLFTVFPDTALSGDTLIGPSKSACSSFTSDPALLTVMTTWIEGFLSAANRSVRADFLKHITAKDVSAFAYLDCQNDPQRTVEQIALDAVSNFRMQSLSPLTR